MSDNVEFRSMTELSAKVTLDGTEEIQVSPSEKVNLLKVIQANAGRVNSFLEGFNTQELYLIDNHTDWLIKGYWGTLKYITISSSDDLPRGAEYTLVLMARIGSTVTVNLETDQFNVQQDPEDPIVKLEGTTLTLLGSGTYIFNIHVNTSVSGQAHDINIDCKYTQPDSIIRYKTYNNIPVSLSSINEYNWGIRDEVRGDISSISNRYVGSLNIGELELESLSPSDSLAIRKIPSLAFSCYEIPIDGETGRVTTHFLSEVWLPSSVTEVAPGAFMGCNYIHKFHGGTPGLVSPDGTQILNTYWNSRVELVAVAPCALGSLVLYPGIGGFIRDEILTFYVDERADSIGDLVFAHMPMSVPIRTVVFGRNVRTIGEQTFFNNACICTIILGDNFLKYNPGQISETGLPSNRPSNLSRIVCSNHLPNGIYPNEDNKKIEYILSVPELYTPLNKTIKAFIEDAFESPVSGTLPNIMRTAYSNLYPLENEIVYSTYDQTGLVTKDIHPVFAYMDRDGWLSGDTPYLEEVTSELIGSLDYSVNGKVIYNGFGTGQNLQTDQSDGPYWRGTLDNPHGLDMFFGNAGSENLGAVLFVGDPTTAPSGSTIRLAGRLKSISFPKSLGALGSQSIMLSSMEGPLDIYLYSLKPILICPARLGQVAPLFILPSGVTTSSLQPITIHTVKGVPIMEQGWSATENLLGDMLTFVDDLSIY